jgi:protein tyrosine phosphatase (PTP) superfamily phosphohydrolase (DUF442 family)
LEESSVAMTLKVQLSLSIACAVLLFTSANRLSAQDEYDPKQAPDVFSMDMGEVKNVHRSGNLIFSGQFSPDDIKAMKQLGIQRVITLRTLGEVNFDEPKSATDAELEFHRVPFASEESLTDDVFVKVRDLLRDDSRKTLLHCGSANRVGGVWLTYRVLDQGVDISTALAEARKIGLKAPFIQRKALDYIKRQKAADLLVPENPKGNADVTFVTATQTADGRWTFEVSARHPDVGWRDFMNGWDVVLPNGKTILLQPNDKFTRVLAHPHVDQKTVTRTQENIPIPAGTESVTVRAHDLVDGYGGRVVEVKLNEAEGTGFKVVR